MIILNDRFGIVKVTTHAIDRLKERFNISKKSVRNIIGKTIENGELKKLDSGIYIVRSPYQLVVAEDDNGYYTIVTILSCDTKKDSKLPERYIKGKRIWS